MTLQDFESRIRTEEAIMAKKLPQFSLFQQEDQYYFEGWYSTSTGDRFQLKLVITNHYPDEMPRLYVISPATLRKYDQGCINSEGSSHEFHTSPNGPEGCVQICHFSSDSWDASCTAVSVMIRGLLWLEAYSLHLLNGKSIADNIEETKRWQKREKTKTSEAPNLSAEKKRKPYFASSYLENLARKEIHSLYVESKLMEF